MGNPKIKAKVFESAGEGFAEIYEDGEMVERSPHFDRLTKVHEWIRSNYPLVGKIPHVVKSKRRNPDTSAEMFEDFHGEPPSTVTEFNETEHYSDDLAKLGTLVELKVRTITGLEATLGFNGSAPELASTPDGRQLYFLGGDQSLDLDKLKMGGTKWERDFMVIGDLDELTYRTAKGFDHFKLSDYYHKLGEESGHMPTLIYDRMNQRLQVAGGRYHNEKSGIND